MDVQLGDLDEGEKAHARLQRSRRLKGTWNYEGISSGKGGAFFFFPRVGEQQHMHLLVKKSPDRDFMALLLEGSFRPCCYDAVATPQRKGDAGVGCSSSLHIDTGKRNNGRKSTSTL